MKEERVKQIKEEILKNWKEANGFLGVKRSKLESFTTAKKSTKKKVIAILRRKSEIILNKRYYFVNGELIK